MITSSTEGKSLKSEHPVDFAAMTHGLFGIEIGRSFAEAIVEGLLRDQMASKVTVAQFKEHLAEIGM